MNDHEEDDDDDDVEERGSIPLLLARPSLRPSAFPPPPPSTPALERPARPEPRPAPRRPPLSTTRLGAIGMLVAAMLAFVAVFADLLASEQPIICKIHGSVLLFPNVTQPAELSDKDSDDIRAEADW
ncbi:MAG TPA: hypothetical protein VIF62_16560, partial [Labilithrix sp.]